MKPIKLEHVFWKIYLIYQKQKVLKVIFWASEALLTMKKHLFRPNYVPGPLFLAILSIFVKAPNTPNFALRRQDASETSVSILKYFYWKA